jgi:hypothetical protein
MARFSADAESRARLLSTPRRFLTRRVKADSKRAALDICFSAALDLSARRSANGPARHDRDIVDIEPEEIADALADGLDDGVGRRGATRLSDNHDAIRASLLGETERDHAPFSHAGQIVHRPLEILRVILAAVDDDEVFRPQTKSCRATDSRGRRCAASRRGWSRRDQARCKPAITEGPASRISPTWRSGSERLSHRRFAPDDSALTRS